MPCLRNRLLPDGKKHQAEHAEKDMSQQDTLAIIANDIERKMNEGSIVTEREYLRHRMGGTTALLQAIADCDLHHT